MYQSQRFNSVNIMIETWLSHDYNSNEVQFKGFVAYRNDWSHTSSAKSKDGKVLLALRKYLK